MNVVPTVVPRMMQTLRRGFMRQCPNCGSGRLFKGILSLSDSCSHCGATFDHIRADDIPAYFTILIVGHVVVSLMLWCLKFDWPTWLGLSIFLPLTVLLTAILLPTIKGATAAHLWRIHLGDALPPKL